MHSRRRRAQIESFEPRILYSADPGPAGLAGTTGGWTTSGSGPLPPPQAARMASAAPPAAARRWRRREERDRQGLNVDIADFGVTKKP